MTPPRPATAVGGAATPAHPTMAPRVPGAAPAAPGQTRPTTPVPGAAPGTALPTARPVGAPASTPVRAPTAAPAPVAHQAPPVAAATPTAPEAAPAAPTAPAVSGGFPSAAKMTAAGGRKPRILIVDDSEMTARIIEADLVTKGFEVHIADSADKATKIILKKQTRPDLVLLDVRMPNVNGEQFCRFIKSNSLFKGIKVLLCSGENVEELQRICREAGADGYVPKDAVLGNLVAKELNPVVPNE
ncbi:response regulator [Cystobacter fuscus]